MSELMTNPYVERRLDWHLQGCVERYGAMGDAPCGCIKRLLRIEAAAHVILEQIDRSAESSLVVSHEATEALRAELEK